MPGEVCTDLRGVCSGMSQSQDRPAWTHRLVHIQIKFIDILDKRSILKVAQHSVFHKEIYLFHLVLFLKLRL